MFEIEGHIHRVEVRVHFRVAARGWTAALTSAPRSAAAAAARCGTVPALSGTFAWPRASLQARQPSCSFLAVCRGGSEPLGRWRRR